MKIGEFSKRTTTSPRLLRYYEEQGLLTPARSDNGYRVYTEHMVDRVVQIRGLLDAGLPTSIIRDVLPCLDNTQTIHMKDVQPDMLVRLELERDRIEKRILCLTRNRDAISAYLRAVREH